jgi:hypothetical protein
MHMVMPIATFFAQSILDGTIGQSNTVSRTFFDQPIQNAIYSHTIARRLQMIVNLSVRQCGFGCIQHFNYGCFRSGISYLFGHAQM